MVQMLQNEIYLQESTRSLNSILVYRNVCFLPVFMVNTFSFAKNFHSRIILSTENKSYLFPLFRGKGWIPILQINRHTLLATYFQSQHLY